MHSLISIYMQVDNLHAYSMGIDALQLKYVRFNIMNLVNNMNELS